MLRIIGLLCLGLVRQGFPAAATGQGGDEADVRLPIHAFRALGLEYERCLRDPGCDALRLSNGSADDSGNLRIYRTGFRSLILGKVSPDDFRGLGEDDIFRKARLLEALADQDFITGLLRLPFQDSIRSDFKSLAKTISSLRACIGMGLESQANPIQSPNLKSAKVNTAFHRLSPEFDRLLLLHFSVERNQYLGRLLQEEPISDALDEYEMDRVLASVPDSIRHTFRTRFLPRFKHKLKLLLSDAVWAAPDRGMSAPRYVVGTFANIGKDDSAALVELIRNFGRKHSDLTYRIDRKNRSTWSDPRINILDSLSESASDAALSVGVSRRLRRELSEIAADSLVFRFPLASHPDFLGLGRTADLLPGYLRQAGNNRPPLASDAWDRIEGAVDRPNQIRDELRNLRRTHRAEYNTLRLMVAQEATHLYLGDCKGLYKLIRKQAEI